MINEFFQKTKLNYKRFRLRLFLRWLSKYVTIVDVVPANSTIAVVAVEDFDPKSNEVWHSLQNHSYARDVYCDECSRQTVMSNGMYKKFTHQGRIQKVICSKCLFNLLKQKTSKSLRAD